MVGLLPPFHTERPRRAFPRAAMALAALSGDAQCIIFSQLCNVLDPGIAVALSSVSNELRAVTQPLLQQLRADHEVAAALCRNVLVMWSCKELREAKKVDCIVSHLSAAADLATLATLGSVLPALEGLQLYKSFCCATTESDGVQRLAERLGAGALPAVTLLQVNSMHVGDAGAVALAAALGRGAMPRLKHLFLGGTGIGDAGLVALAPSLRRLPALETLVLSGNPFGDEGLAALVAPLPLPSSAPPPLTKLRVLDLEHTQVSDAGCATLAAALNSGVLPALARLDLDGTPASDAVKVGLQRAVARQRLSQCPVTATLMLGDYY